MDNNKLIKEIITTTTERYGDNGNVKEKITESREKIYSTSYTEEEMNNAKVVEPSQSVETGEIPPSSASPTKSTISQEEIREAAAVIDAQSKGHGKDNPFVPWQPPATPQYNVTNRNTAEGAPTTKFPWEK